VAAVVSSTTPAAAKTDVEVGLFARSVTVEIKLQNSDLAGSGVLLYRQGDLYTVITNRHVACGANKKCTSLPTNNVYNIGTADGQKHRVNANAAKILGQDVDLAIIQFRSSKSYPLAPVAALGTLKVQDAVYTGGFPAGNPEFTFGKGEAMAVVNKRLVGDNGGYTIAYNSPTFPGMSGGGVYNAAGQLVAIHGAGDRYQENSLANASRAGEKVGLNRGIPIQWVILGLRKAGINVGGQPLVANMAATNAVTADEHFIAGFNKTINPGDNFRAGKMQAIQEFTTAIKINPQYAVAYYVRGRTYEDIQLGAKALNDYSKVIELDPRNGHAYYNRGYLRAENNDLQGAFADYNQALKLLPDNFNLYFNRANVKDRLNDAQGSLADYNRALQLNPKFASAYYNRGVLKFEKFKDVAGAMADFNTTIKLEPQDPKGYFNRSIIKQFQLQDFKGAAADLSKVIELDPKNVRAYLNRGILRGDKLNDRPGAIQDIRQASALYKQQGQTKEYKMTLEMLAALGAN
jgi:tetratricopeptide (TPR) repeat protein